MDKDYDYAHNDTSVGERRTVTAQFNKPRLTAEIQRLRAEAFARGIPTADDETLNFLITYLRAYAPENILELGTATGISGCVMLSICSAAHLTTVERNEQFYREAQQNFANSGFKNRVTPVYGDAGEIIESLEGGYDLIFLDCAKVQYIKYLPRLKKLLKKGGTLIADDILLYGWITGEAEVPKKRKMLAQHVREYIYAVISDEELETTILNVGDGVALSVKL